MALKTSLNKRSVHSMFFAAFITVVMVLCSCSGVTPVPPATGLPEPEIIDKPESDLTVADSRMLASHSLTQEGYQLIRKKDFDGAIRILERAVGINPSDGPGYFYLAEAWIGKNNFNMASQFNRLAAMYLRDDPTWSQQAEYQKKRIKRGLKGL